MDRLIKQLRRDFQKNPKKAGMLGLLFLVAGWFWLPLILPAEKKPSKKMPTAAAVPTAADLVSPTAAVAAPTWRWQDLDRSLQQDPRMRSAGPAATNEQRNPFLAHVAPIDADAAFDEILAEAAAEAEAEAQAAVQETVVAAADPGLLDTLTLSLSSTIVGGRAKRAVINGRAFNEGETIGLESGIPIVLAQVEPRRAIVAWNGRRRELRILRPGEPSTAALPNAFLSQ